MYGSRDLKILKCGCKKQFTASGKMRHFGGDDTYTGVNKQWKYCDYHTKKRKMDALTVKMKEHKKKIVKLTELVARYPNEIQALADELSKTEEPDTTITLNRSVHSYE